MGGSGKPESTTASCGQAIAKLRVKKNVSRRQVIARLLRELHEDDPLYEQVDISWLRRLEDGQVVKLPRHTILALGRALRCTQAELNELLLIADRNPLADDDGNMSPIAREIAELALCLKSDPTAQRMIERALSDPRAAKLTPEGRLQLFKHILQTLTPDLPIDHALGHSQGTGAVARQES